VLTHAEALSIHTTYGIMTPEEYIELYEKFLSGKLTPEEENALNSYQDNFFIQDNDQLSKLSPDDKLTRHTIYRKIRHSVSDHKFRTIKSPWMWAAAAAIMIVALGLGNMLLKDKKQLLITSNRPKKNVHKAIVPGSNNAILTLADGSTILLDDAKNGLMGNPGTSAVKKLKDGLISYTGNAAGQGKTNEEALNIITIPRGGQYTVILPDGTKVWLNSASSLTYPVAFNGIQRKVELKGEAYFEVAKNKQLPFVVHTGKVDVKVLGTHFNVTAYQDEAEIKTTLLEGSVKLTVGSASALLVPGQQGISGSAEDRIITKTVNVNQVVAWKSGYFIFRDSDIKDIMKQIGRWYDVEIEYEGNIPERTFGGTYAKNKDITELLKGLELTGLVHFKIDGRRIIVMS